MHVDFVVVPQRHHENHALVESGTHALHATLLGKVVGVAEDRLLVLAEVVVDRISADASNVGCGLIENLTTLDVLAADLDKVSASSVVRGNELGDDCERLGGVDGLARAVEGGVAYRTSQLSVSMSSWVGLINLVPILNGLKSQPSLSQ